MRYLTSSSMSAGLLGPVLCLLLEVGFLDLLLELFCRDVDILFFFLGLTVKQVQSVKDPEK